MNSLNTVASNSFRSIYFFAVAMKLCTFLGVLEDHPLHMILRVAISACRIFYVKEAIDKAYAEADT